MKKTWMVVAVAASLLPGAVSRAEGYGPGNSLGTPVTLASGFCASGQVGVADFDADGADDVFCQNADGSADVLMTAQSAAANLKQNASAIWNPSALPAGSCPAGSTLGAADVDADGRSDLYCHQLGAPFGTTVALSLPVAGAHVRFRAPQPWRTPPCTTDLRVGRFDGNASDDLLCFEPGAHGGAVWVALSAATVPVILAGSLGSFCSTGQLGTADLLGRGQSDLWCHDPTSGALTVALAPSATTGPLMFAPPQTWMTGFCTAPNSRFGVDPMSGDSRADAWCWDGGSKDLWLAVNNGSSMNSGRELRGAWCADYPGATLIPGANDFNGDGQVDLACHDNYGRIHGAISAPGIGFLDNGDPWTATFGGFCRGSELLRSGSFAGHKLPADKGKRTELGCLDRNAKSWSVAGSLSTGEVLGTNPVLAGTTNIYIDFYGNFTPLQLVGIMQLLNGSSNSAFSNILTSYGAHNGTPSGSYQVKAWVNDGTHAANPIDTDITLQLRGGYQTVLERHWADGSFPIDPNGVYFVIGDPTLPTQDDGSACGHHEWMFYSKAGAQPLVTALIAGDTINPFWNHGNGGGCGYFQDKAAPHAGTPPNGDVFLDNVASIIMHELFEAITNPYVGPNQAWNQPALGWQEVADMCGGRYGDSLVIDSTGIAYNLSLPAFNRKFLVQEMWANLGPNLGVCGMFKPHAPLLFPPITGF